MKQNSSNRGFGILFFVVFMLVSIWPFIYGEQLRIWPLPIAVIFLILGLLKSKLLTPLNLAWIKFGEILGKIIAPLVMGVIYFIIITPSGLIMRLIGKYIL